MANTDYTDKQHEEHVAAYKRTRAFPENSVFDPRQGNGRLFRKATPEELAAIGEAPAAPKADGKED